MSHHIFLGPDGMTNVSVEWTQEGPLFEPIERSGSSYLVPGFVDQHIHGGFGVDLMSAEPRDLVHLAEKLEKRGYEFFLPTTVTASCDSVKRAISNIPNHPMIPGFHLEGPFISPQFPGAQPKEYIIAPPEGPSEWDEVLDHSSLRIVTLAPEYPTALALITRLMKRGVKVQFGHTNANYDEARAGYEFGASGATHFFNAMRPFHHREAGVVGYGLTNEDLYTELIYDRHHVCKESAAHLFKSKPKTRVLAVSDATCAAGLPKGSEVDMWGHHATVGPNDVRLSDGTLAGSVTTLDIAFKYIAEDHGIESAIRTCCMNPRFYLGLTNPPKLWLEFDKHFELIEMHRVG